MQVGSEGWRGMIYIQTDEREEKEAQEKERHDDGAELSAVLRVFL